MDAKEKAAGAGSAIGTFIGAAVKLAFYIVAILAMLKYLHG